MAASPSPLPALLPDSELLRLDEVLQLQDVTVLVVTVIVGLARCPRCGTISDRVHSWYGRTVRDLPSHGLAVEIRLRTRRFYCREEACRRRVFTQPLPGVCAPYARQTHRHRSAVLAIGYALGGEAGARLALQLSIRVSGDTVLRITRQSGMPTETAVRVLGIDDWAWRRGHRYGTVLIDLERHKPIDLLPDREADTLADWLRRHPTVQIISRDRAGAYADGARRGAPTAVQIADRFHLFANLTTALQRVLERLTRLLRVIEPPEATFIQAAEVRAELAPVNAAERTGPPNLNQHERARQVNRDKRKARFDAVLAAHNRGLTQRAIATELGMTRKTVRRYLRAKEFPERAPRRQHSVLDAHRGYLERRWAEGCHNASQLCRELRQQGYGGQRSRVKEYLQPWRARPIGSGPVLPRRLPNLKLVAFWLAKPSEKRARDEQVWVTTLTAGNAQIARAESLAQQFREVFKEGMAEGLQSWLTEAAASGIPELERFVAGLRRDYAAVEAAVTQPWSNGQVEGQVHRIKLLKRQMYGRSGFLLLRSRVLPFRAPRPTIST